MKHQARLLGARAVVASLAVTSLLTPFASAGSPGGVRDARADRAGAVADLTDDSAAAVRGVEAARALPMRFEPNLGQTDSRVLYLARGAGYAVYLTNTGATLALTARRPANVEMGTLAKDQTQTAQREAIRMEIVGARGDATLQSEQLLDGRSNYFIGHDASKWITNVPQFGAIRYVGVYDGIDAIFYGKQNTLEYDFVVAPGADPSQIRVRFEGQESADVTADGDLLLTTKNGELRQLRAVVTQEGVSGKRDVSARYEVDYDGTVGFALSDYDPTLPLVIDPPLVYADFIGGTGLDRPRRVAVDPTGAVYITGQTESSDFPTRPGSFDTLFNGFQDAFVSKISADGSTLVYSTFLGGGSSEAGNDIAVDQTGSAYVVGETQSSGFPVTVGAFDTSWNQFSDGFVTKLNPDGASLAFSTFLGGGSNDYANAFAFDSSSNIYVTGYTYSPNFPIRTPAFDTTHNGLQDVFVSKLSANGGTLLNSTFVGSVSSAANEHGEGIAVDAAGNAYVVGQAEGTFYPTTVGAFDRTENGLMDAFLTKLLPDFSGLVYSTFLGSGGVDIAKAVAVDGSGNAYVVGDTGNGNPVFPTTIGAFDTTFNGGEDTFITKFNAAGSGLVYSTFLGGFSNDFMGFSVHLDAGSILTVAGYTFSSDFPTTMDGADTTFNGSSDCFVTRLNASGTAPFYSTFVGGTAIDECYDVAFDFTNSAYITGITDSPNFALTGFGVRGQSNGFVARVRTVGEPGADTPGIYTAGTGTWFLRNSNSSGGADITFNYGPSSSTFIPIKGDWNNNDTDTPGLYDPAAGAFFLKNSSAGGNADIVFVFGPGGSGVVPIAGDWNGDGTDTVGLYVQATGVFFLRNTNSTGSADVAFNFGPGGGGLVPITGDWDNNGTDTVGLYNPATGTFFLRNSNSSGGADIVLTFGGPGLVPLTGDWNGDGTDTIGVYDPATGTFFLRNSNSSGGADIVFTFGGTPATPLMGDWNGQ
jgi:hypothetical protein